MAMQFKPFGCNIHAHSDASLDGGSSVEKIVKRAKELGLGHIVLTEHGNMNSAAALAMYAEKAKLPFSHGIEVYLDPPFTAKSVEEQVKETITEESGSTDKRSYMHLTVLFKTQKAYEYFCKLTPTMESRAVTRFGERKPIITWPELEEIGPEIVIGSGCLVGFIQKWVLAGRPDLAERAYQMCRSIVKPGCFFVELFPHCVTHEWQKPKRDDAGRIIEAGKFVPNECTPEGTPKDIQLVPNKFGMELAAKYGDRVVVSEDSHFAYPAQKAVQDARLGNGQENWRFYTSYHMRDPWTCFQELLKQGITNNQMQEFVDNSYALKDELSGYKFMTSKDRWILPEFEGNSVHHMAELIKKHGRMPKNDPRYVERLKYEISVLGKNGIADFLPYIFQVEDVAAWCKDNGILMNLRGSAGGSLLYYLAGASITDPIKYNLPFERHITLGRIRSGAIPDADMDFSSKSRVVDEYLSKFGDRIVSLSTNINLKVKNSIRDAERTILGKVRPETEAMCARFPGIPQGPTEEEWLFGYTDKDSGEHVEGFWDQSEELQAYAKSNPEIWSMVSECLGVMRNKGSHACGFLITPKPAHEYFPLTWVGSKNGGHLCTGFEPKGLEHSGGIKYDFLGVQTLEVIRICTALILQRYGVQLEWREYDHDPKVYESIFWTGDTPGVFQFNTHVAKPLLKKIKPTSTQDLSAITALGRPGTLQAPAPDGSGRTCAEYYVAVAAGEKPYYLHPDLESILKETNGVILYQEQLLHSFVALGGYTLEEAEEVRRAISKKKKDVLEKHLGNLKDALVNKQGWKKAQADLFCEQLLASNRYSFNKAHSMSYAIVAYNTAYLKKHYPLEFWTAELTVFGGVEEKLKAYIPIVSDLILQPSISKSDAMAWKIEGDKIRAPLSVIKGLGPSATEAITKTAPYTSVEDFAERCSGRAVNRGVFAKLVMAGLFDEFNQTADDMLARYWGKKKIKEPVPAEYQNLDDISKFVHRSQLNMLAQEKLTEIVGPKLLSKGWKTTGKKEVPYVLLPQGVIMVSDANAAVKYLNNPYVTQMRKDVYMVGLFISSSVETTKTGKKLLKVKLSDGSTEYEAVDWNRLSALKLPKGSLVVVGGKLKKGYKVPISISMGSIEPL